MTISPTVTLMLRDTVGGTVYELPFNTIQWINELNFGKQITLNLDYPSLKALATTYSTTVAQLFTATMREIQVYVNGNLQWLGVVTEFDISRDASGGYQVTVAGVDYFSLLQKRRTGSTMLSFTAADPATIPMSLINTSQALTYGNLGITAGVTAVTGLAVTVTYKNAELRTEIINLSNARQLGSFDFDLDVTKKLNLYYPFMGTVRQNIILDDNNILGMTAKVPMLLSMTNSVFATGQGINNDQAVVNVQASGSTINSYTLLEDVISDPGAADTNVLSNEGSKFIQLNQLPLTMISVKHEGGDPDITTYAIGDTLTVNIPEAGVNNGLYRVKKQTIDVDQAGAITVQLDMLVV